MVFTLAYLTQYVRASIANMWLYPDRLIMVFLMTPKKAYLIISVFIFLSEKLEN
jgi:cytochrome c oxidase subunit IV